MESKTVNLLGFARKIQTKKSVKILTYEGRIYLPLYKYCTVDFIAGILKDKKKVCALLLNLILTFLLGH
jgi:hypothetical protein